MLEKRIALEQQTPLSQKKLIVSHAPFYHSGQRVTERSYHTMLAALPALLMGFYHYGMPAFGELLKSVATYFREQREEVRRQGAKLTEVLGRLEPPAAGDDVPVSAEPLAKLRNSLGRTFDQEYGGFGGAPKFPHPTDLELCLRAWAKEPERSKRLDEEMQKLSILEAGSPEYAVTRNYLDTLTSLPWGKYTEDKLDLERARDMLELGLPPTRGFEVRGDGDRFFARFTGGHGTATIDETGRLRRRP